MLTKQRLVLAAFLTVSLGAFLRGSLHAGPGPDGDVPQAEVPMVSALLDNLVVETIADALFFPVSMTFAPDGRLFYVEKGGRVRVITFDQGFTNPLVQSQPWLQVAVDDGGEQGLLGIALYPDWETEKRVYLFYVDAETGDKIVAYWTENDAGTAAEQGSRTQVWRITNEQASNHNGGNIGFGADGMLYITVGDDGGGAFGGRRRAVDLSNPDGKIHRINPDGSPPSDNPFYDDGDPGSGNDDRVWAYGLRNSFDFDIHPVTQDLWASENGPHCNDELNRIVAGGNYGWVPDWSCEGQPAATVSPLYVWDPPIAVTGVDVYTGKTIPQWYGDVFVAAWGNEALHRFAIDDALHDIDGAPEIVLRSSGGPLTAPSGARLDVVTGPDGNLWVATQGAYNSESATGAIYRLVNTACVLFADYDAPPDGEVRLADVRAIADRWNAHWGDDRYQLRFDWDLDGDVDIFDVMNVGVRWGDSCPS